MMRSEAVEELRRMAAGVEESDPKAGPDAAAARLLERVSTLDNAAELRAALAEIGAAALFDPLLVLG